MPSATSSRSPTPSATPSPGSGVKPSDFNGDGYVDLAIGVESEAFGSRDSNYGVVNVLYGSAKGLRAVGTQLWSQASHGIDGKAGSRDRFGSALASGDFDDDGYADLAVGAPHDEVEYVDRSGGVNILYGSAQGLTAKDDWYWTASSMGVTQAVGAWDERGAALAAADFDGDGYADLAIGAHGAGPGAIIGVGEVDVLFGGPEGLNGPATALKRAMTGATDLATACHYFGDSLATGNLNGDGYADLVIGAPAPCDVAGGDVSVFYGSAAGLNATGSQLWSQDSPGIDDQADSTDRFGWAVAIGDFDEDGYDDLAVSAPGELLGDPGSSSVLGAPSSRPGRIVYGAVHVIRGSPSGLTADGSQLFTALEPALWAAGDPRDFGTTLAAGDLDGDGADDLAIAVPAGGPRRGGEVALLYGAAGGLSAADLEVWSQDSPGVPDRSEHADTFGASLAIADYGWSREGDLAVGVVNEAVGDAGAAGLVNVLYGTPSGLSETHAQAWTQSTPGVKDSAENRDDFGSALTP